MLYPKLLHCSNCDSIPAVLDDIDCRLKEMAVGQYNNIVFSLNNRFQKEVIDTLLNYKRILRYKYCNPDYADICEISLEQIVSRVKVLINK